MLSFTLLLGVGLAGVGQPDAALERPTVQVVPEGAEGFQATLYGQPLDAWNFANLVGDQTTMVGVESQLQRANDWEGVARMAALGTGAGALTAWWLISQPSLSAVGGDGDRYVPNGVESESGQLLIPMGLRMGLGIPLASAAALTAYLPLHFGAQRTRRQAMDPNNWYTAASAEHHVAEAEDSVYGSPGGPVRLYLGVAPNGFMLNGDF